MCSCTWESVLNEERILKAVYTASLRKKPAQAGELGEGFHIGDALHQQQQQQIEEPKWKIVIYGTIV